MIYAEVRNPRMYFQGKWRRISFMTFEREVCEAFGFENSWDVQDENNTPSSGCLQADLVQIRYGQPELRASSCIPGVSTHYWKTVSCYSWKSGATPKESLFH